MIVTEGPFPGPYTFARSPYLQEIVDNLSIRSTPLETVLIKANQIGASMCSFGVSVLHRQGHRPQLFISGDAAMAEEAFSNALTDYRNRRTATKIRAVVKRKSTSSATGDKNPSNHTAAHSSYAPSAQIRRQARSFPSQINYIEDLTYSTTTQGQGKPD